MPRLAAVHSLPQKMHMPPNSWRTRAHSNFDMVWRGAMISRKPRETLYCIRVKCLVPGMCGLTIELSGPRRVGAWAARRKIT